MKNSPFRPTMSAALVDDTLLFEAISSRVSGPKPTAAADGCPPFMSLTKNGKRAVLSIYDEISWWSGNDAKTFRQTLAALDVDTIELRINSPGGSVFEGVAIYNMLAAHPATVEVHIDGLCASIASVIALAGETRTTAENGIWMIHDPSVMVRGKSEDLRKFADVLDKIKEAILNTYEARTGQPRAELAAMMAAETYMTAEEALEKGFSTATAAALAAAACAPQWSAAKFAHLPEPARALGKPAAQTPPPPPAPPAPAFVGTPEDVQTARDNIAAIAARHGF